MRPGGRPCRAASTAKPISRTAPSWSMSTFSGTSRPWATPASWARARRVGHLGDDPGGDGRRQRLAVGEQDVQAGARPPLVDHEAAVGGLVDVEHPQHPAVEDRGGRAGRLAEQGSALVVAGDDVHGDVALQDRVEGAPEPAAPALGQQVGQSVPVGEHVAGPGVLGTIPLPVARGPILGVACAPATGARRCPRTVVTSREPHQPGQDDEDATSTAAQERPPAAPAIDVRDVVPAARQEPPAGPGGDTGRIRRRSAGAPGTAPARGSPARRAGAAACR